MRLDVFDVLGQSVGTLVNDRLGSGSHSVTFDASKLGTGMYVYRLSTPTQNIAKKMLLTK